MADRIPPGKIPFVFEKRSKWSRLSNQQIIDLLLNSTPYSPFWNSIFQRKSTMIVGSTVYKWLLRGEQITDIDAICTNPKTISEIIVKNEPSANNPYVSDPPYGGWTNYKLIKFTGTPSMTVDLISYDAFVTSINRTGLSMANALILTDEGIRHVLEVPEIKGDIALETQDPEAERDWVISQIKAGKYCVWRGMRNKDKEYFKSWQAINPVECAMHGMFHDKLVRQSDLVNPHGRSKYSMRKD